MLNIFKIFYLSVIIGFIFLQSYIKSDNVNNYLKINYDSLKSGIDSAEIKIEQLTEGRNLYEKKCGRCHMLHEPDEYNVKQWKRNLKEMKEKAELNKKEYFLILGYLTEYSKK